MPATDDAHIMHIQAGLNAHRAGDLSAAIDAYRQALAGAPDDPVALNLLGAALVQLGDAEAAVAYLERAAARQRGNPGVLGNLAQAYFALGRYEAAREAFRKASRADPRHAHYQLGIANSCAMQGELAQAETLLHRIVQRFPGEPLAWFNYGNVLRDQGRVADALPYFQRAATLAPHFTEARNNLAGALHNLQRFEEAEKEFRACIAQDSGYLLARCNLASVLIDLGRFREAEVECREVLRADPQMTIAHTYLGVTLGHQGRLTEALRSYAAATRTECSMRTSQSHAGALADVGRYAESMRWFRRAFTYDTQSAAAHQVFGTSQLARGCVVEGWEHYAWRPARQRLLEQYPKLGLTDELPDDLRHQHVCVLAEQGLGDEVYFLRWASVLKDRGARITYRSSRKMYSLLTRATAIDNLIAADDGPPPADYHLLVGDLPRALSTLPSSVAPTLPAERYTACTTDFPERIALFWPPVPPPLRLIPLAERLAAVRDCLMRAGPPPYLALTWRGGTPPEQQQGASWVLYKEIAIGRLAAAVTRFPGTVLALQRKPAPGEIEAFSTALGRPLHDFTAFNDDLENMLALLTLIDEYVGVSNTNMHLRASVGGAARVLVPCPAEWRWMQAGPRSPWFPGFSVYRQSVQGDWDAALAALSNDLSQAYGMASR